MKKPFGMCTDRAATARTPPPARQAAGRAGSFARQRLQPTSGNGVDNITVFNDGDFWCVGFPNLDSETYVLTVSGGAAPSLGTATGLDVDPMNCVS